MASNGLIQKAKKGKCRICQRVRDTEKYLKAVGEVSHGYATGHIWECENIDDCEKASLNKMNSNKTDYVTKHAIKIERDIGRYTSYRHYS